MTFSKFFFPPATHTHADRFTANLGAEDLQHAQQVLFYSNCKVARLCIHSTMCSSFCKRPRACTRVCAADSKALFPAIWKGLLFTSMCVQNPAGWPPLAMHCMQIACLRSWNKSTEGFMLCMTTKSLHAPSCPRAMLETGSQ